MSRKVFDHKHVYERVGERIYRCIVPDCRHSINVDLLLYRTAACYKCEATFTIQRSHLKLKRIKCGNCDKKETKPIAVDPDNLLANVAKLNRPTSRAIEKEKQNDTSGTESQNTSIGS